MAMECLSDILIWTKQAKTNTGQNDFVVALILKRLIER